MVADANVANSDLTLREPSRDSAGATVTRKPDIDYTLVYGDLLFATHRDRCVYIGMSSAERARWREQEKGKFQRISDVQQKPQLGPLDDVGATGLSQPASLTAPAKENLPNGSTETGPLPSAQAATREIKRPKTQASPVRDSGHKPGRSGSRDLEEQKLPAKRSKAGRKRSPERMRIFLDALAEYPILGHAAAKASIHPKTPAYWKKCSEAGHDGYDLAWRGDQGRFHEHCESAIDSAHDELEYLWWQKAVGVTFKTDPFLVDLGCKGSDAYARDRNGKLIEEASGRPNFKMTRLYFECKLPEKYGKRRKRDIPQSGGVLVIGGPTNKPEINNAASVKARQWKSISRKVRGP